MWNRKTSPAANMALGGMLAAVALVIMGLGGMIPVATYICPVADMMILQVIFKICGRRIAWAWYGAVAILSLLISPDKEAAGVFLFLGSYPILKPWMDRKKIPFLWKACYFNSLILLLYWMLMHLMGMAALQEEFSQMGRFMVISLLILGNLTFFLLDLILGGKIRRRKRNG